MKLYLTFILLLIACPWAKSQIWQPVGPSDFNQPYKGDANVYDKGYAYLSDITIDQLGMPIVTFMDPDSEIVTAVRRFNGSTWEDLGMLNYRRSSIPAIVVAPSGIPYILSSDENIVVRRFTNNNWEPAGILEGWNDVRDLVADSAGTIYVACLEPFVYRISVYRLRGNQWELVGDRGFSEQGARNVQMAAAPDGTIFVSYSIGSFVPKAYVMQFKDTAWEKVGSLGSLKGVYNPSLAIDHLGTPYVAYSDYLNGYRAAVAWFNGSEWEVMTGNGMPLGKSFPEIAIDASGIPYLAIFDSINGFKASVVRYNGQQWEMAGDAGFSNTVPSDFSIAIDQAGTPYVSFSEVLPNMDHRIYKLRVMKLMYNTWMDIEGTNRLIRPAYFHTLVTDRTDSLLMVYNYKALGTLDGRIMTRILKLRNNNWEKTGNDFYLPGASNQKVADGINNTLFIAYNDELRGNRTTVVQFDGQNWKTLGTEGFTEGSSQHTIAVDPEGIPYVAYSNLTNGRTAYVKIYNGTDWEMLGTNSYADSAAYSAIAIDKWGTVYVAYSDLARGRRISVKKFTGQDCETVGNPDISVPNINTIALNIDSTGLPYVAYDYANVKLISVIKKFNGNTWETLVEGALPTGCYIDNVVMDAGGTHYLPKMEYDLQNKASVLKFTPRSTFWEYAGNRAFSAGIAGLQQVAISSKGKLYTSFLNNGVYTYQYMDDCMPPDSRGTIEGNQSSCLAFDPDSITSISSPTGYKGTLEYKWQSSTLGNSNGFTDINHSEENYDPGIISQTTWFRRMARVSCMTGWQEARISNVVKMTVFTPPVFDCPANDTIFNDPGSLFARKSYSALPQWKSDTLAVYLIDGKPINFPYDFPIGNTTIQVKANSTCTDKVACSFTVMVRQFTGTEQLDDNKTSVDIYPNPFAHEMAIEIANPLNSKVSADIYNLSGQKIKSLVRAQKGHRISLHWDGANEQGQQVPAGVYILKVNEMRWKVVKGE